MIVGYLLLAMVAAVAALPLLRRAYVFSHGLIRPGGQWDVTEESDRGLRVVGGSALAALTLSALSVAFFGYGGAFGGVLAGGPPSAPAEAVGPPNAPNINLVTPVVDSVTFRVVMDAFSGSQDDTHDSTRIMVDSAGKDFTSPLVDSVVGPVTTDTIRHAFQDGAVYDFVALYRGATGGWSDTSSISQVTVEFTPAQITTLSVVAQTDSSLTIQWVTVHDGTGSKANHSRRYKNVTGDTASFSWGGTQESASEVFDSLGTNIGDTASAEVFGLLAGNAYEFGIKAYRGEPNVSATYGPTSNIASGTTVGNPPVDTTNTPSITGRTVSDSSTVSFTGSGFAGGSQTHDSTKWEVSRYAGTFSTLIDSTSAAAKTSVTIVSNTVFKADTVYAARVTYYGSADPSTVSDTVAFTMTEPGGGGEHPNEPVDFDVLRTWTGTSLVPSGWGEADTGPAKHSKVDTVGLPSGNSALYRHTYPAGMTRNGAGTEFLFSESGGWFTNSDRLYISMWVRPDPDWVGHPSGTNKIFYISVPKASGGLDHNFIVKMQGVGSGNLVVAVTVQNIFWCSGSSEVYISDDQFPRGEWKFLEFLGTMNTPGNADGSFKVWVGGTLALDVNTGCHMEFSQHTSNDRFLAMRTDAIYGGTAAGTLAATQVLDLDDIYISGGPR
jgi:hypothetical protein